MKIEIINKDGVRVEIDPKDILVNEKPLGTWLKQLIRVEAEFRNLKKELLEREEKVLAQWEKLR